MMHFAVVSSLFLFFTSPHQTPKVTIGQPALQANVATNRWTYEKQVDTEKRTVYKASTRSPTQLVLGFPYVGGSTATLTIRKRVGSDTHVYIQLANGQFNRSFQGGTVLVRFDDGRPKAYSFSAAENGSANIIFFDATQALLQRLKASRTMVVDVAFAGKGNRQLTFRTADLRWAY